MKDYRAIAEPDGTFRVIEESTLFAGLSEAEAQETVETYKIRQAQLERTYLQTQRALADADSILERLGIVVE